MEASNGSPGVPDRLMEGRAQAFVRTTEDGGSDLSVVETFEQIDNRLGEAPKDGWIQVTHVRAVVLDPEAGWEGMVNDTFPMVYRVDQIIGYGAVSEINWRSYMLRCLPRPMTVPFLGGGSAAIPDPPVG